MFKKQNVDRSGTYPLCRFAFLLVLENCPLNINALRAKKSAETAFLVTSAPDDMFSFCSPMADKAAACGGTAGLDPKTWL
jgi:hypothetical protein